MGGHSSGETGTGFVGRVATNLWNRVPLSEDSRWNLEEIFQPEDLQKRLLPRESVQIEIRLAWYRDIMGHIVFNYFRWLLGLTILVAFITTLVSFFRGAETTADFEWSFSIAADP